MISKNTNYGIQDKMKPIYSNAIVHPKSSWWKAACSNYSLYETTQSFIALITIAVSPWNNDCDCK